MHRNGRLAAGFALALTFLLPAPEARANTPGLLGDADARTIEIVRQGAMRRLRSPECQKVLTDFADLQGRPLTQRLALFALPPDEYLGRLSFLDGSRRPLCQARKAEMVTTPGAGRVLVCPTFLPIVWKDRTLAEVYVIHEMLHTLGLGEDPPTSRQITRQVEQRCAP
jgi:hypothetical protein